MDFLIPHICACQNVTQTFRFVSMDQAIGLPNLYFQIRGRGGLVVNTSDSGSRDRGFEPHSGHRVVSMSKTYLPPKNTGNTQEAVTPSQHD